MAWVAMIPCLLYIYNMIQNSVANSEIIENSIVGEPEMKCNLEGIGISIVTVHSFFGRLYVQGESNDPNCVRLHYGDDQQSYTVDGLPDDNRQLKFFLKFGECNMRRQRTLKPRGVAYTFTLIVSFHPIFETESDRAYRIQCFFTESVKALEATLDVSQLTTQFIEREFALPTCSYEIRESRTGPFVEFAHVGDHVWHVWHCDLEAGMMYGMLIHSCYVDDGQGKHVQVVDNKGCVLEPLLLSDIEYDDQAITAYAETKVFKYSDKIQLYFTCTVQLCVKNDGGCNDVTPPICSNAEYLTPMPIKYSSSHHGYYSDQPVSHNYEPKKEFFGPINAARREIESNFHVTSPSSQKSSVQNGSSGISTRSRKLRVRRGIDLRNNLKMKKLTAPEMQVAEMDLTTRIVVFPLVEIQSLNVSSSNDKAVKKGSNIILAYLSSPGILLLLSIVTLLSGASCFIAILLTRCKKSHIISFMDNKTLNKTPAYRPR